MIVILSNLPERANSKTLNSLFRTVHERCENSEEYCLEAKPLPKPGSIKDAQKGVCVKLNERVKLHMYEDMQRGVFKGVELRSARRDQLGENTNG